MPYKDKDVARAYAREWDTRNREKRRTYARKYYLADIDVQRARARKRYQDNPEYFRLWNQANSERRVKRIMDREKTDPIFKAKRNEWMREYNLRVKRQVFEHYGTRCACCGESEEQFLCIDHIGGGGCQQRKALKLAAGSRFYAWLRRQGFPSGYRTLCHNCNMARGFHGFCPHETKVASFMRSALRVV